MRPWIEYTDRNGCEVTPIDSGLLDCVCDECLYAIGHLPPNYPVPAPMNLPPTDLRSITAWINKRAFDHWYETL